MTFADILKWLRPAKNANDIKTRVILGDDAQRFIESEIGQTIIRRADNEIEGFVRQLIEADAADQVTVRRLQSEILRREQGIAWLLEMIDQGHNALETLTQAEE